METTPWDPEGATYVLDHDGRLASSESTPATGDGSSPEGLDLRAYYKQLVAARCVDGRLCEAGLPMWASAAGEEAPLVATSLVAGAEDWVYPGARDVAFAVSRGLPLEELARQLRGQSDAGGPGLPGRAASVDLRIATTPDALGLQLPMAAGQAHGQKLAGSGQITFALFGEGSTTAGVFHETVALAVAADLPLVLVCRSQVWPEAAPAEAGVLGDPVAERARAAGLWARRVDGADPIAVYLTLRDAAERARRGSGPGLIEVVVTQLQHKPPGHRDPVERLRRHLDLTGLWTATFQDVIEADVRSRFDRAMAMAGEEVTTR